jgi:hypothetical protein
MLRASKLVSDACFLSGLLKIDTKHEDDDGWQDPWRPKAVYHYIQWKDLEARCGCRRDGILREKDRSRYGIQNTVLRSQ